MDREAPTQSLSSYCLQISTWSFGGLRGAAVELLHLRPVNTVGERVARDALSTEAVEEVEGLGLDLVRAVLVKVGDATVDEVLVVLLAAALDGAVEVVLVQAADLVTDVNDTLDEALVDGVGAVRVSGVRGGGIVRRGMGEGVGRQR